jgi:putative flippase GtrA
MTRSRKIFSLKEELWIAVKYGFVGISNTIVFTASVYLLSLTDMDYMYFTAIGYIIAISYSFTMNLTFTFRRFPGAVLPRAVKFVVTAVSLMLVAEAIQYVLIERVGMRELYGIVLGMITYTAFGFTINRFWVFR